MKPSKHDTVQLLERSKLAVVPCQATEDVQAGFVTQSILDSFSLASEESLNLRLNDQNRHLDAVHETLHGKLFATLQPVKGGLDFEGPESLTHTPANRCWRVRIVQ